MNKTPYASKEVISKDMNTLLKHSQDRSASSAGPLKRFGGSLSLRAPLSNQSKIINRFCNWCFHLSEEDYRMLNNGEVIVEG